MKRRCVKYVFNISVNDEEIIPIPCLRLLRELGALQENGGGLQTKSSQHQILVNAFFILQVIWFLPPGFYGGRIEMAKPLPSARLVPAVMWPLPSPNGSPWPPCHLVNLSLHQYLKVLISLFLPPPSPSLYIGAFKWEVCRQDCDTKMLASWGNQPSVGASSQPLVVA